MDGDKDIIDFGDDAGEMATRPGHWRPLPPLTSYGTVGGSGLSWWQKWIIGYFSI